MEFELLEYLEIIVRCDLKFELLEYCVIMLRLDVVHQPAENARSTSIPERWHRDLHLRDLAGEIFVNGPPRGLRRDQLGEPQALCRVRYLGDWICGL